MSTIKNIRKERRHRRVRSRIVGTSDRPRLTIFRSHRSLFVQFIDDVSHNTILGLRSGSLSSFEFGKLLAKKATESGINRVSFDRGGYAYHGRVKAFVDGIREGGLHL